MMRTFKKEIIDIINRYKDRKDWKVKENSETPDAKSASISLFAYISLKT